MKTYLLTLALIAAGAGSLAAQQRVNETIPSAATGRVEIENLSGSVRVVGWNRDEIRVTGTLGEGTERLAIEGGRENTEIRVVVPRNSRNVKGSDLEIRVPVRKRVDVRTVSADIGVDGVTGAVGARSTSGDVQVGGSPAEVNAGSTSGDVVIAARNPVRVQAQTTSGDVEVSGAVRETINVESTSGDVEVSAGAPEVRARTVSGDLRLHGVTGRVSASTVSGDARVAGSRIQYGAFESVSGDVRYEGALQNGAALNMKSHSGNVELALPRDVAARFEVGTFSGDIINELGPEPRRKSRYGPGMELDFTTGSGQGVVVLETFSGTVRILGR